jgi:hypothetical protein
MTNCWRKLVLKEADFVFEVPVGTAGVWERDMHEPLLLIAVCLPFLEHSPWKIGGTPRILALGGQFHGVWKDPEGDCFAQTSQHPKEAIRRVGRVGVQSVILRWWVISSMSMNQVKREVLFGTREEMSYVIWWHAVEIICNVLSNASFAFFKC